VILRLFRRTPRTSPSAGWWHEADRLAEAPVADRIDALAAALTGDTSLPLDEREQRDEMIEGLRHLLAVASDSGLPTVETQHRVIGTDPCHFMTPVSLAGASGSPGKLFLTSRRLIIASASVTALPWHRVRHLTRAGRDLVAGVSAEQLVHLQCNSYGDALIVRHLASRLMPPRGGA
jgi:hypothetical protein